MGIRLIVECLDRVPSDLGRPERLLLIALAEKADDLTREVRWARGENPRETLGRRTGLSPASLRDTFQRLASRGLEVRRQRGVDSRGRPVFAHEGAAVEYRIPHFDQAAGQVIRPGDNPSSGDGFPSPLQAREVTDSRASGDGFPSPLHAQEVTGNRHPSPSVPQNPSAPAKPPAPRSDAPAAEIDAARTLTARLSPAVTIEQAAACVAAVTARKAPDDVARYVQRFTAQDVARWAGSGTPRNRTTQRTAPARRRCATGALIADDGTCCVTCTTTTHALGEETA